jgi:hypothetical protein
MRVMAHVVARPITNTAIALRPNTPSASINTADSTPSTTNPVTRIAQQGSNQLSLETPRNGAGKLFESYVLPQADCQNTFYRH